MRRAQFAAEDYVISAVLIGGLMPLLPDQRRLWPSRVPLSVKSSTYRLLFSVVGQALVLMLGATFR